MLLEFKILLARRLLSWANRLDRDGKIVCDAHEGWYFRRQWKQPRNLANSAKPLENLVGGDGLEPPTPSV